MSISGHKIHLIKSGSTDHDITGPICVPSVGPTLLTQLRAMVMALALSIPATDMMAAVTTSMMISNVKKAKIDTNRLR